MNNHTTQPEPAQSPSGDPVEYTTKHWKTNEPYLLRYEYGIYWLDEDDHYAGREALKKVIADLQTQLDYVESGRGTHALVAERRDKNFDQMVKEAIWHFDDTSRYLPSDNGVRRPNLQSGDCVYFVIPDSDTNIIKIGFTGDVYKRVKSLRFKYRTKFTALAIVQTPQCQEFERLIHSRFIRWRYDGEWFDSGIVSDWLDTMRKEVQP